METQKRKAVNLDDDYDMLDDILLMDPLFMRSDSNPQPDLDKSSSLYKPDYLVKISTVKLMDEIYDKYLLELPDDLTQALKLCEATKIELISQLFAQKISEGEMALALVMENEQESQLEDQLLKGIKQQRSVVEKFINACVYERIAGEQKFLYLRVLQSMVQRRVDEKFNQEFQKDNFENKAQIMKKFYQEFWLWIDSNFDVVLREEFDTLLKNVDENLKIVIQPFLKNYLLEKSKTFLYDRVDEFIQEFLSTFEFNWQKYIKKRLADIRKGEEDDYEAEQNDIDLQIIFDIMIRLPLKKEVQLEIVHMNSKMMQFAFANNLDLSIDDYWQDTNEIEIYLELLEVKILSRQTQDEKEQYVSQLLFKIIHYFIDNCYTSCDRELLKTLLLTLQPVLQNTLMNGKALDISFYLTIFEREIAAPCTQEDYELKELAQEQFKNDIGTLNIDEGLSKARILNLQKISSYRSKSRHVVICISGFLTEDVEKKESWRHVINHYKYAEVFSLNWNSLTVDNFYNEGHYTNKESSLTRKLRILKTGKKQFIYALEQTRVAGTMLAIFLLKSDFSQNRAISLIGHSLGTVIILHTLNILHHFYKRGNSRAGRIINDAQLWGGAVVLNPQGKFEETLQKSKICSIVAGKLCNCYSLKDYVLKYMFMPIMSDFEPIGLVPIFEDLPNDDELGDSRVKLKRAYNYDCTVEAPGHTLYSENCDKILEKIPFSF